MDYRRYLHCLFRRIFMAERNPYEEFERNSGYRIHQVRLSLTDMSLVDTLSLVPGTLNGFSQREIIIENL